MALHQLHSAGFAHGRPNLKDILWDGERIAFIDFERFGVIARPQRAQVADLMLFGLSCFAVADHLPSVIDDALLSYRQLDQNGVWQKAIWWSDRLGVLETIVKLFPKRMWQARDVRAALQLIARLKHLKKPTIS